VVSSKNQVSSKLKDLTSLPSTQISQLKAKGQITRINLTVLHKQRIANVDTNALLLKGANLTW
jgi:hypothetical protein